MVADDRVDPFVGDGSDSVLYVVAEVFAELVEFGSVARCVLVWPDVDDEYARVSVGCFDRLDPARLCLIDRGALLAASARLRVS